MGRVSRLNISNQGGPMASQAPVSQVQETQEQHNRRVAARNCWIVTGYAISGLAVLGFIFYAIANYAVR